MNNKVVSTMFLAAIVSVSTAKAGVMQWGSIDSGDNAVTFTDNNANTFSGYAYLFLLSATPQAVAWDGTQWLLNSAVQIAFTPAGSLDATPGTFGDWNGSISDANMIAGRSYQIILTTATGNNTLTAVNSGYWSGTSFAQITEYTEIDGANKGGKLGWTTTGSWAPVAAVPEPATMALFGLGGLALVIRRKMRKEA